MTSPMPTSTRAAVLVQTNAPLQILRLQLPALLPGQVLVKVAYSGVCHTQLLEIQGKRGPDRFLPHALGHEGSGVVHHVGAGVSKVEAGDHVVLTWIKGSGLEVPATRYQAEIGPVNSGAISTFMDWTVVSENRLVPIPAVVPLREAALLGCAIPTGAGIVLKSAGVTPGSSVAVFGAGGIGLSAILACVIAGAHPIIAVDIHHKKLELALSMGATHAIDASDGQLQQQLAALGCPQGVDYSIECAGQTRAMEAAYAAVRAGGGLCVVAGNVPHGQRLSLDPYDLIKGKRIQGTWGGETDPDTDIPRYAAWFGEGKLPLAHLATDEYELPAINEAFSALERGELGRALIRMEEA